MQYADYSVDILFRNASQNIFFRHLVTCDKPAGDSRIHVVIFFTPSEKTSAEKQERKQFKDSFHNGKFFRLPFNGENDLIQLLKAVFFI
jgi:hypothetical protein